MTVCIKGPLAFLMLTCTALQSPKHSLQRNSDEGLPGDQRCQTEQVTAGHPVEDVPNGRGPPRNDSALFSSVDPLDHTPPVTDEKSQRRSMQAGFNQNSIHASCPELKASCCEH